jgi:hypothetical protein
MAEILGLGPHPGFRLARAVRLREARAMGCLSIQIFMVAAAPD